MNYEVRCVFCGGFRTAGQNYCDKCQQLVNKVRTQEKRIITVLESASREIAESMNEFITRIAEHMAAKDLEIERQRDFIRRCMDHIKRLKGKDEDDNRENEGN